MQSFIYQSLAYSSFFVSSAAQQQYLDPAPAYIVQPDPYAYGDWVPVAGHGTFSDKNETVTPWKPYAARLPPSYPVPSVCGVKSPAAQEQFWLENLPARNQGMSPFLVDGQDYKVFRNVKDYGAIGDGVTDDTDAFNRAITEQSRMGGGKGRGGSTGQPALIYIPSGTYIISSTIQLYIGTQVIGDAIDPPIIKAAPIMRNNSHMISGYDYGQPSTNNFYMGLRNVILDTTDADPADTIYALNWAVSQATNLIYVDFVMPEKSKHVGINMDGGQSGGGSGLFMGDLTFTGGLIGLLFNNQQYALRGLKFENVGTAIAVKHAFVLTMLEIECINVGICVDMGPLDVAGSINLIDSSCNTCGVVVNGSSSIVLENIAVQNSGPTLKINGTSKGIGDLSGKTYAVGHVYRNVTGQSATPNGTFLPYTDRGSLIRSNGRYFTKKQPQYTDHPASAFASVKAAGAKGDGMTDDTAAIQQALLANADCRITYFPHGVYLVTDTIYIPPGSRLVGEVWSVITASGKHFADESQPQPMIQVGKPGEIGIAEFSDLLFSVADILPGAIIVEVNMAGGEQGDVSFHNTHYRIGGAVDSRIETGCTDTSRPCKAAFMVLHLRETSSTYIENAWLWTADHDLDGADTQQVATGRGAYIQSKQATWLVGTASEHHTLYAYQFDNAQNAFAALLQVESPYWQPTPRAPAPWTPNATWNDPTFADCEQNHHNVSQCSMQWALRIRGQETRTLPLYGQALWVFFNNKNACSGPEENCQVNDVDLRDLRPGSGIALYNVNTRSVQNIISVSSSSGVGASNGTLELAGKENAGSWGAVVAAYLGFA